MNPVRQFFDWWFGQLAELFRGGFGGPASAAADALIVVPHSPLAAGVASVSLIERKDGKETAPRRLELAAGGDGDAAHSGSATIILRLPAQEILEKTLTLPLAAERNLGEVLALEMDRETPFEADELYWTYRVETRDRQLRSLSVRLAMVPREKLRALFDALATRRIVPNRLEAADRDWRWRLGAADPMVRSGEHLFWPAAACCAALAVTAIALPFARQAAALAAVDREIAAGRAETSGSEALLTEIAQRSAAVALIERERDKAGGLLTVLAAATRVLPDNSFLTEMTLRQRKVTLIGRSTAAARLLAAVAADGTFRDPAFAAPVTRIEAAGTEVFTISAEVAP